MKISLGLCCLMAAISFPASAQIIPPPLMVPSPIQPLIASVIPIIPPITPCSYYSRHHRRAPRRCQRPALAAHRGGAGLQIILSAADGTSYSAEQNTLIRNRLLTNERECRSTMSDRSEYDIEGCMAERAEQSWSSGEFGPGRRLVIIRPERPGQ